MAEERPQPKGKAGGNVFTKKYGPLKGWQWTATIAAGGAVFIYIRNKRAANSAAATGATNATDPNAPPLEQLGSGVDSSSGSTPLPGSDVFASLLANQQAGDAKLQGENNRQKAQITALQKAVAKLTPKKQTAAKKVAAAKKPPAVKKNTAPPKAATAKPVTSPQTRTSPLAVTASRALLGNAPAPVPAKVAR